MVCLSSFCKERPEGDRLRSNPESLHKGMEECVVSRAGGIAQVSPPTARWGHRPPGLDVLDLTGLSPLALASLSDFLLT
jgi:hypothetical protein